jgi:virginiamycin B lyase
MFNITTNTFKEYSIPTPNSTAGSVTVDSSGNVWFTELTANKLGELPSASSKISEFTIPNASFSISGLSHPVSCGPIGVIAGPRNSLWIMCLFSNQIDEFFPTNSTFDSFDLPSFQSGPAGLVFDHSGNFWFTAADVNMIGHGVVSELRNNTSNGITETAPVNSTYRFTFAHTIDFIGHTENITSSLPTPSGIAISPDGRTLWITEHVDSSFDSYNIATQSIDRYWLSQTYGAFGYPISFPNGVAVDGNGNVWIAEHYGNRVAEYNPTTGRLTEYKVPCCGAESAGVYTLTLGKNGTVWFVEILGDAIGELSPVSTPQQSFAVSVPTVPVSINTSIGSSVNVPVSIDYSINSSTKTTLSLNVSGVSYSGALPVGSYNFQSSSIQVSGSGSTSDNLTISSSSLNRGIYYLTVSATPSSGNAIYSSIVKLVVGHGGPSGSSSYSQLIIYGTAIGIIVAIAVVAVLSLAKRRKKGRGQRKPRHR